MLFLLLRIWPNNLYSDLMEIIFRWIVKEITNRRLNMCPLLTSSMKKRVEGNRECWGWGVTISHKVEKQDPEESERKGLQIFGEEHSNWRNSRCKGPGVRVCLAVGRWVWLEWNELGKEQQALRSVSSGGFGAGHFQNKGFYSERSKCEPEGVKGFCNCTGREYTQGY